MVKETKKTDQSAGYPADFVTEIDALFKFRSCSTIVRIDGVCFDSKQKRGFLLLEHVDTNLRRWYSGAKFPDRLGAVPILISQIGGALAIMHSVGFIHNDIKNNNILSNNDGNDFKLVDFGKCRYVTNSLATYGAIARYRPYHHRDVFSEELYAFCVVLIETIIGKNMIQCKSDDPREIGKTIKRFYDKYGKKPNVKEIIKDNLTSDEYHQVQKLDIFWNYVNPIISGAYSSSSVSGVKALRKVGYGISKQTLESIQNTLSTQDEFHPRLEIVRRRCHKIINRANYKKAFVNTELFDRLMSKFLYTEDGSKLDDRNLMYYSEIALITILGKHYLIPELPMSEQQILSFQRAFLGVLEYQTIVLPQTS